MSEYVKHQLATALRTLPWYVGIPGVLCAAFLIVLRIVDPAPNMEVYWGFFKGAMLIGLLAWFLRQAVRLLWTIRTITRAV
jgi:hypothetical protein